MIMAAHQPNFLPWLGYFYKMARADVFAFSDIHDLGGQSFTNRVRIKTREGPQWLTVPVLRSGLGDQPILDVHCGGASRWRAKLARTIEVNYCRAPYFEDLWGELRDILLGEEEMLSVLNQRLIACCAKRLGITTPTVLSSGMKTRKVTPTQYIVDRCIELGADTYLSGFGGANYQDESAFARAGIRLVYSDFKHPVYPQIFGEFVTGLSAIDLLFNCGPESRTVLGL